MSSGKRFVGRFRSLALALVTFSMPALSVAGGNSHVAYKQTAIFGTAATWVYAAAVGLPLGNCQDSGLNLRGEYGVDSEILLQTVSVHQSECKLISNSHLNLGYLPIFSITKWSGDARSVYAKSSSDIAFVPMIRLEPKISGAPLLIDIEVGVGAAFMERTSVGVKRKTTHFQFSDHFGIGVGNHSKDWRVGFSFRHLSNLDLGEPNNGVNFFGASLEIRLK